LGRCVNQVALSGIVLEAKPLRYTPAGLPVLELVLQHTSEVMQAGHARHIEMAVNATAMGDTALLLADITLGSPLHITGFLAPSRKGSSRLVLHIQQVNRASGSDTVVV